MAALTLESVIGFGGDVPGGLQVHPDREHLVYPLGSTVVVEKIAGKKGQSFLAGHNNSVSAIAISRSGRYVASGQVANSGVTADIIVWDFAERKLLHKFCLHKRKVQGLAFSANDAYLASLGGQDDGRVALWDLSTGKALAGAETGNGRSGMANCVAFASTDDNVFTTAGTNHMRIWDFNPTNGKMTGNDCGIRGLKRTVNCVSVSDDDSTLYYGTATGDIVEINMSSRNLKSVGPERTKFEKGVQSLSVLKNGNILVGAGDGTAAVVNPAKWKVTRSKKVEGSVTSIGVRGDGHEFFVGTDQANIYRFGYADFASSQRFTGHSVGVNDVVFTPESSEIFITCAGNEIRIWHTVSSQLLLRIQVATDTTCNCIAISPNGGLILSGWSDGCIRAFLPETGKKVFELGNANGAGVTALAFCGDPQRFISGGGNGQVRLWCIEDKTASLQATLKEHTAVVTSLHISETDEECVSSSEDGTCIIWNLNSMTRRQIIFSNTLFRAVRYNPDESQAITVGTDRKVGYWEVYDGSLIREREVTNTGQLNTCDISPDGSTFVVGGSDQEIQVYSYKTCERLAVGVGHAASINRAKICPRMAHIVSVSADGAIYRWGFP